MKTKIISITIVVLIIYTLSSCSKAGTGGDATVVCSVFNSDNNGAASNGATVYVKYGQSTPPSQNTTGYDDHQVASATTNTVSFAGLKKGTYYFLAVGTETITSSQGTATVQVSGGAAFSLTHADGTSNASVSVGY